MALAALRLRLRRAASLSSSLLRLHPLSPTAPPPLSPFTTTHPNPSHVTPLQSRRFRSSPLSLSSARSSFRDNNNSFGEEIGPDTILFEGCDYNHWLITMDFPKDPAPTREEMIETYLQTLAKVVGSYEEAKKKMYACSTTTYQGFQCLVSEEESEKFKGLPGVVFVLPDSYIDPVNKEYGGDKYDNGVITPRPPPVQYGRQGGRYGDRNRDFNRGPRQMPNEQGSRGYDNQGPRYGDNRNFGQQQNPSVPNQQSNQGYHNQGPRYTDNRNFGQHQNPSVPNQQGNQLYDNQGPRYGDNRNFERLQNPSVLNQQGNRGYDNQGPSYRDVRNSGQLQTPSVQPNYGPIGGGERRNPLPMNTTPGGRDSIPPYQGNNYNQNQQEYYNPQGVARAQSDQRGYPGDNRNYAPLQGVTQGQGTGGNYGQMGGGNGQESSGNYGQMPGGNYGQGAGENNSQGFQYQQMERRNNDEVGQRNFGQVGQSGRDQGRY